MDVWILNVLVDATRHRWRNRNGGLVFVWWTFIQGPFLSSNISHTPCTLTFPGRKGGGGVTYGSLSDALAL